MQRSSSRSNPPNFPLYGMLTDRFGITRIVDVAKEHDA